MTRPAKEVANGFQLTSQTPPKRGLPKDVRGKISSAIFGTAFVLCAALTAHLVFSANGFNPTDEGYYLSNARRVLDGETPHRDFISLRPAGAYYIFAPVVAFGGDSVIWIARFIVLVEMAMIAWIWSLMIQREFGEPFGRSPPAAPAAVAFILMLGWYPLDVSTSIEGFLCYSVALFVLLRSETQTRRAFGYVVMGCAYLCRQNLLFAACLTLIAMGDWRQLRYWIAVGIPGILYLGWLATSRGLADFFAQLGAPSTNGSSPGGFFAIGVSHWVEQSLLFSGILVGLVAGWLIGRREFRDKSSGTRSTIYGVAAVLVVSAGGSAVTMRYGHGPVVPDYRWYSFAACGLVAGLLLALRWSSGVWPTGWRLTAAALSVAWAISFSWAFPAPTLAMGVLVLLALALAGSAAEPRAAAEFRRRSAAALALFAIPLAAILYQARQGWIALDAPAARLTQSLDGVFPGAGHLRTDTNTYAYLVDFQRAVRLAGSGDIAIGPDLAAYWIRSDKRNPLSINWLFYGELINASLERRVLTELQIKRGTYTFIASKVMVRGIADGFAPVPPFWSPVQDSVTARFTKVGETRYFELYR